MVTKHTMVKAHGIAKLTVACLLTLGALTDTGCDMPSCGGKKGGQGGNQNQQAARINPTPATTPPAVVQPAPVVAPDATPAVQTQLQAPDPIAVKTTSARLLSGNGDSFADPDPPTYPQLSLLDPTLPARPEAGMVLLDPAKYPILSGMVSPTLETP